MLRLYRVRVRPDRLGDYEAFERDEGIPMVRAMEGCLGCGFGRVAGAAEPTYVFFSLWRNRDHLEMARATPTWQRVASKLESLGFSLGGDHSEHVELRAFTGAAPK